VDYGINLVFLHGVTCAITFAARSPFYGERITKIIVSGSFQMADLWAQGERKSFVILLIHRNSSQEE